MELQQINPSLRDLNAYFETYTNYIRSFACEKAKEFAETEKQPLIPTPLQMALVTLSQKEKLFSSLAFFQQKAWFGRQELLQNSYESLRDTFVNIQKHEVRETSGKQPVTDFSDAICTVCLQLADYCAARIELINFYINISKTLAMSSIQELQKEVQNLVDAYSSKLDGVFLSPMKIFLMDELRCLILLFQAALAISDWKYIDAICYMQEISSLFAKWKPLLTKNQGSSTFRSGFFGFGEKVSPNPTSALFNWLEKFFYSLVAKFTFYFYEGLSHDASPDEMKSFSSKTAFDFVLKCLNFIKRNDVKNIQLLMDVSDIKCSLKHGYNFPDEALSADDDASLEEDFFPCLCLPQAGASDLSKIAALLRVNRTSFFPGKVVHLRDADARISLFCCQLEPRLIMVVNCSNRKPDKEGPFDNFLSEIFQHTDLKRIGHLLKPGFK